MQKFLKRVFTNKKFHVIIRTTKKLRRRKMSIYTKKITDTKPLAELVLDEDGEEVAKLAFIARALRNDLLRYDSTFAIFVRGPLTSDQKKVLGNLSELFNSQINQYFSGFARQGKPMYVPDRDELLKLYNRSLNSNYKIETLEKEWEDTLRDCIAKNYETARECGYVQKNSPNPITNYTGEAKRRW